MNGVGRDIVEIASLLIGLTMFGLVITRSSDTAKVIKAGTSGFSDLLAVASFQGRSPGFGGITY